MKTRRALSLIKIFYIISYKTKKCYCEQYFFNQVFLSDRLSSMLTLIISAFSYIEI